jgi:tellurium resistance protein TerD
MSGISLEKGQKVSLSKTGLNNFYVGLGWKEDPNQDLDVSAFVNEVNSAGESRLLTEKHMIFFNNTLSADGAVRHSGDNLTGEGDGDDEFLIIDLSKIDPRAGEISIVCNIFKAAEKSQNFGQVKNAYIRICDLVESNEMIDGPNGPVRRYPHGAPGTEQFRFDLSEDASVFTAVQFGSIYLHNGSEWKFAATGAGFKADLGAILQSYSPIAYQA